MMKPLFLFAAFLFTMHYSHAQWEPDVRLSNNADSSLTIYGIIHQIAASGDTVHVVWWDKSDGNWEIYYIRSTDGGVSWPTTTRLTNDPKTSQYPSIAVSGSFVHVVWCDWKTGNREIYYRRSTDGGTSWDDEQRLTNDTANSHLPSISISGSYVHLVWTSRDDSKMAYEVHYKHSTDGGTTWGPETWLSSDYYIASGQSIASAGPNVLVVWSDSRTGNSEIYARRSTDGGLNWGEDEQLTNALGASELPSVSMSGSSIYVVWRDQREGGPRIFYKQSVDGGLSWGEDIRLTNTISASPNIASCDTLVSFVWEDYRNGIPEIFCKYSMDGGSIWSADSLLNDISLSSQRPFIAISGSALHTIWFDFRDGNFEIYYKRNPTGLPVGIKEDRMINSEGIVRIYPNPSSRQLTVDSKQSAVSGLSRVDYDKGSAVRFSIYDLFGREVKEFGNISTFPYQIDISGLPDGVYLLKIIEDPGNIGSVKFLKISK